MNFFGCCESVVLSLSSSIFGSEWTIRSAVCWLTTTTNRRKEELNLKKKKKRKSCAFRRRKLWILVFFFIIFNSLVRSLARSFDFILKTYSIYALHEFIAIYTYPAHATATAHTECSTRDANVWIQYLHCVCAIVNKLYYLPKPYEKWNKNKTQEIIIINKEEARRRKKKKRQ